MDVVGQEGVEHADGDVFGSYGWHTRSLGEAPGVWTCSTVGESRWSTTEVFFVRAGSVLAATVTVSSVGVVRLAARKLSVR